MTGRHEKSIQYYERAMQLSPRDAQSFEAYTGISYPYFFLGHYDQAIYWSERALREKPRYIPALLVRLAALAMEGSHPERSTKGASATQFGYAPSHVDLGNSVRFARAFPIRPRAFRNGAPEGGTSRIMGRLQSAIGPLMDMSSLRTNVRF